jgi:uncharacterized phage protein (TIGR02216 family)
MTFADAAIKLAGHAALSLGWRPDDFWNATPAELASIIAAASTDVAAADSQILNDLMKAFPDAPTGGH